MAYIRVKGEVVDNEVDFDDPYAPFDVVISRFDNTLAKAEEVYTLLVGEDGSGGFLGSLNEAISSAPSVSITAPVVNDALTLETSGASVPTFDESDLQDFPADTYEAPTMAVLPSVDTEFDDIEEPDDVAVSLSWSESALDSTVYDAIIDRMLNDLQSGATGLDPAVEVAIYQRARNRQQVDRQAEWDRINNTAGEMQFALPSGVLASALTDFSIGANRQDADIENQIIVAQGDLAQKNSQFMFQQAVALEQLIRQTRSEESSRALDAAKTMASLIVEDFKARVQKYVSIWDGRKAKIQAQVEALRGVIESNRGLIDIFKAQYDALKTRVDAVAAYNKGLTDVYLGQVQGFSEAERAVANRNDSVVKLLSEQIKNADMTLRAAISEAEQTIAGYSAEHSLKERVASDLAQIAAQVVASMMSAVHAGATLGYSGSESSSKSFNMSTGLNESHSFEHDPTT